MVYINIVQHSQEDTDHSVYFGWVLYYLKSAANVVSIHAGVQAIVFNPNDVVQKLPLEGNVDTQLYRMVNSIREAFDGWIFICLEQGRDSSLSSHEVEIWRFRSGQSLTFDCFFEAQKLANRYPGEVAFLHAGKMDAIGGGKSNGFDEVFSNSRSLQSVAVSLDQRRERYNLNGDETIGEYIVKHGGLENVVVTPTVAVRVV